MGTCIVCGLPIRLDEEPIQLEDGYAHELCADPQEAMAAGIWEPSEGFEHGDF